MDYGEWVYRLSLVSFLQGCGLEASAELHGHIGRSDIVLEYNNVFWVLELKVFRGREKKENCADAALKQAIGKGYGMRYLEPVILGIAIDAHPNVRHITAFKVADPDNRKDK